MKKIQFSIDEETYVKAKQVLIKKGLTWQSVSEDMVNCIVSEDLDVLGIPIEEMAFDRNSFENKIQEKFVGAMREYAFVILAKKNNKTKWVEHKENEVERLMLEMEDVFDFKTKGKWDKKKAALQAVDFYNDRLKSFVTKANNSYLKYYNESPSSNISVEDLISKVDEFRILIGRQNK